MDVATNHETKLGAGSINCNRLDFKSVLIHTFPSFATSLITKIKKEKSKNKDEKRTTKSKRKKVDQKKPI